MSAAGLTPRRAASIYLASLSSYFDEFIWHSPFETGAGIAALVRRLLLPTAGGPHASRAAEYAADLARFRGGSLTLLTVLRPGDSSERQMEEANRLQDEAEALRESTGLADVKTRVVRHPSIVAGILESALEFDGIVIGADDQGCSRRVLSGIIPERIARASDRAVIMVKRHIAVEALVKRVLAD